MRRSQAWRVKRLRPPVQGCDELRHGDIVTTEGPSRALSPLRAPLMRWPRRIDLGWIACAGLAALLALLAAREIVHGHGQLVALGTAGAAFMVWALSRPEHAALGVIVVLPFMFYPASTGGLSLFAAVPLIGGASVAMVLAQHGSPARLRHRLAGRLFAVVLVVAGVIALHSIEPSKALSRVLYLAMFGLLAWALAASITAGRLRVRTLAAAMVVSAALAAVALIVQVVVQFGAGQQSVTDWLSNQLTLFGGQNAATVGASTKNWLVGSLGIVRGIFPFMAAPSAGQYMMLGLVAAVWLSRERGAGSTLRARRLSALAVLLIAAGLLATFSRQSWIGALVGVGALSLRRSPVRPVLIIAGLFLVLSVTPVPGAHSTFGDYLLTASDTTTTSSATRLGLWSQALQLIPHHLVFGVGPGLYGTLNPDPSKPVYYAHNVWLDEFVELGLVGGLALIALFVASMRSAFRRGATLGFALLAAFAVANLFDDVLYFPRNGILLACAFALAATADRPRRAPASPLVLAEVTPQLTPARSP
jgi:O-antigen ligase